MSQSNNNRPSLNNKTLIIECNRGMTADEIARKYAFSSTEEFMNFVKRFGNSRQLLNSLKRNQKAKEKAIKAASGDEPSLKNPETVEETPSAVVGVEEEADESETVDTIKDTVVDDVITSEDSSATVLSPLDRLAELVSLESELSARCISLETEHKSIYQSRKKVDDELSKVRTTLNEILRLIKANKNRISGLQIQHDKLSEELLTKCKELSEARSKLSEVRAEIDELKKVSVLVYPDYIEIENFEVPDVSESAIDSWFKNLSSAPEAEELKLKEVKNIAKLLCVLEILRANHTPFELVFDSEQSQKLYEAVSAQ